MTIFEALAELDVQPGADAETIRRAYLRLIKTRKPESDPEGFKRAREAYEVAREAGAIASLVDANLQRPASAPDNAAPVAATPPEAAPAGVDAPAGTGAPTANEAAFQGFATAWKAVPPSADQRQRLEIAREAVAALPDDPRAHWLLVSSLSGWQGDAALAEALRGGWSHGWPEFLEALLVRLPGRITREEVDAAFASRFPNLRLAAAAASAPWEGGTRSAALIVEMCAAAAGATPDEDRFLPIGRMLDVVLALRQAGHREAAKTAHTAIATWLHDSGLELQLAQGPIGGLWTLVEELMGLPDHFPEELARPFAAAARSGDLSPALHDAAAYASNRHRSEVRGWAQALRGTATTVSRVLEAAVEHAAAQKYAPRRDFRLGFLWWLVIPVFSALARNCAREDTVPRYAPSIAPAPPPQIGGPEPGLEMVRQAAGELCGEAGPRYGQLLCADIQALFTSLGAQDCTDAKGRLRALQKALPKPKRTELEERLMTRIELAAWSSCPTQGTTVVEGGGGSGGP